MGSEYATKFRREQCVLLPSLLRPPTLTDCYNYVCRMANSGATRSGDRQVADTPCAYGDPFIDTILLALLPQVENCAGMKLFPTYSYFRVYKRGDILPKHTDRPACEISVTLCLGGDRVWPFWLEGSNGVVNLEMAPGDGLVYRGIECTHWREAFEGDRLAQAFLHYVDKNGPHADWKFDKRKATSSPLNDSLARMLATPSDCHQ
jgi:hypothetical protein